MPRLSVTATSTLVAALWCGVALSAEKQAKLSFGAPKPVEKAAGFSGRGAERSAGPKSNDRDRKYARDLLTKYDSDGNRVLEESEWRRISGDPEKADTNGDKRITFDELVARVTKRRREKEAVRKDDKPKRKSYRVLSAQDKLPEGLPSWFRQKDRNGDGQVAMHEYSRRWTDSTARKFRDLDNNDDGLITPDEASR